MIIDNVDYKSILEAEARIKDIQVKFDNLCEEAKALRSAINHRHECNLQNDTYQFDNIY